MENKTEEEKINLIQEFIKFSFLKSRFSNREMYKWIIDELKRLDYYYTKIKFIE